jgi:hypothetical protein
MLYQHVAQLMWVPPLPCKSGGQLQLRGIQQTSRSMHMFGIR